MENPTEILKKYWGYESFRKLQEDIIKNILSGNDTLAILPTGGGKSICFQVPALIFDGCCIVISPLIALMEDQVRNLNEKGIAAACIISGMTNDEIEKILIDCSKNELKLLYISPERIDTRIFKEYLPDMDVSMIAVDESHCISQWGYDFRPSYLQISKLREYFPKAPVIALTASATSIVRGDIISKLNFKSYKTFMGSFARPNLAYTVEFSTDKINRIHHLLKKTIGSGLIYCKTRRRTKEISDILSEFGISCDFYHAGLTQDLRKAKLENWIENKTRIIVCTNAFGMGIDKPDVRIVIHADMPDCIENYYQEAGRAGRDEKYADAILLYNHNDLEDLKNLPDIKYPSIQTIRKVYHALANYLQIPSGSGVDLYFDFDFDDFVLKFKLNPIEAIHSIQAMRQEGIISYIDQISIPAKVQFYCSRNDLFEFEQHHPHIEPIIKALLRNYSGIWDIEVSINEKHLAWLSRLKIEDVTEGLNTLKKSGIIRYIPRKESPQIKYLQNRTKTGDLHLRYDEYFERKRQYVSRIEKMINYTTGMNCRATFVADYFEAGEMDECGTCDNCSNKKTTKTSFSDFSAIHHQIMKLLENGPIQLNQIFELLSDNQIVIREVLDELKRENKIGLDVMGGIFLK